jgi:hypothetical protein
LLLSRPFLRSAFWLASRVLYGNGAHADWAYERIQRPRTCVALALNLLNYAFRHARVFRITGLVVEPVFGCNLRCNGCWGSLDLAGRRPGLMDEGLFRKVIDGTPDYVETVMFGLMGEPLMHPRLPDMVAYAAHRGLRASVFTNGTLLSGERLRTLAASPVSVLNVSVETDSATAKSERGVDLDLVRENVGSFVAAKHPTTEVKLSLVVHAGNSDRLGRVRRDWAGLATQVKLSPRMGIGAEGPPVLCMEPWRGNLNVLSNGDVSPCCFDCYGDLRIGSAADSDLASIAANGAYRDLLARFLVGDAPSRCRRCIQYAPEKVPTRARKRVLGSSRHGS